MRISTPAWAAVATATVLAAAAAAPAAADERFTACQSQRSLEQVVDSDGQLMPDDCRPVEITAFDHDGTRLCVVNLSQTDQGMLQALRDAAMPERWWFRCDRAVTPGG